jgi:hypothetical protein
MQQQTVQMEHIYLLKHQRLENQVRNYNFILGHKFIHTFSPLNLFLNLRPESFIIE